MHNVFFQDCEWYPFICFKKSTYVDNSAAKVPITEKFGSRVQISTSKIWNASYKYTKFQHLYRDLTYLYVEKQILQYTFVLKYNINNFHKSMVIKREHIGIKYCKNHLLKSNTLSNKRSVFLYTQI